ncbi:MAG: DUF362 domain-containing protein [Candidatus Bathyarchaeota archaeon]|nr:DUF362 domain-containing protein [Candidatus Bathyarchaeota archaeon]
MTYRVAIVKTTNGVKEATKEAIRLLGGISKFINLGETTLLKPNLFTVKGPETGATTDMQIVLATAELLQTQGSHCIIGECPATASYTRPDIVFDELGVRKLSEANGIEINVLDRDPPVKVEIKGVVKNEFWYPETAMKHPIINFPKLKTHSLTTLTCAVKNLFGLQQGGTKAHHHVTVGNDAESFSHLLLDIYQGIKPQCRLHVVDAHIAMEGEGPSSGDPVPLGLIIAGADAVAVDLVSAAIMGWDPVNEVGTNYLAIQRGIGPAGLHEVEILGESIDNVKTPMKKPEIHQDGQMFIDIRMPIIVDTDNCIACGVCAKVCPAGVITIAETPEFNMDKCIQCFCCVELCPHKALKAVRPDE